MMIDPTKLAYKSVACQTVPPEGPRVVPVALDFTATTELTLDLSNLIQRGFISMIQAVFVDNEDSNAVLQVANQNTNQKVSTAPGHQGYKQLLCPNPAKLVFTSQAGIVINVALLNFPVINSDWNTQA